MKLTNQEILDLYSGLMGVGNLKGARFAYAVARNLRLLKTKVSELRKLSDFLPDYLEYEKDRVALATEMAVKVDGQPKLTLENGQQSFVMEDRAAFDLRIEELQKKHKPALDNREEQKIKFDEALKQEDDIDFYMIPSSYLPDDITPNQTNSIFPIIQQAVHVK